jgi:hypothetical protein
MTDELFDCHSEPPALEAARRKLDGLNVQLSRAFEDLAPSLVIADLRNAIERQERLVCALEAARLAK